MSDEEDLRIPPIAWLDVVREAPGDYVARAKRWLALPAVAPPVAAVLHGVLALAALEQHDAVTAVDEAVRAVELDDPALPAAARAELHGALINAYSLSNRLDEALEAVDRAETLLGAEAAGPLALRRAVVHYRRGELPEAFGSVDRAVDLLGPDQRRDRARALNNRGVLRLYVGGLVAGLRDLEEAETLYLAEGLVMHAADTRHNRGMMLGRLGDLPAAIATFADAERQLVALGEPIDAQIVARCEVLVNAGLSDDVLRDLPAVLERLEAAGMAADAGEARLYLATARLAAGDDHGVAAAEDAARVLRAAGADGWAAVADDLAARAATAARGSGALTTEEAVGLAERLEHAGMRVFAGPAWLRALRAALAHGDAEVARAAWLRLTERRRTLTERVLAAEATAWLRLADGRHDEARRAAERGLRLIDRNRSLFEATELRVTASGWGIGLAEVLMEVARRSGSDELLFAASERWRGTGVLTRPSLPPPDDEMRALLAEYRLAAEAVGASPGTDEEAAARVIEAERRVTDAVRIRRLDRTPHRTPRGVDLGPVGSGLDGRVVISFSRVGGELLASIVRPHEVSTISLGTAWDIDRANAAAIRGLRQLSAVVGHRSAGLVHRSVIAHVGRLRSMLAGPLEPSLGDAAEIVVLPDDTTAGVPWGLLFDRPVSVSPSLALWRRAGTRFERSGPVVSVSGPGLDGAVIEARDVARIHSGQLLEGDGATTGGVLAALDGAGMAHLACHARFAARSPLFSSLGLADGPLTAYELERIADPPGAMVLSACSSGALATRAGGELLGLTTVLLSAGCAALVASVVPLPDLLAVPRVRAFHRRLAEGMAVGEAMHTELAGRSPDDPESTLFAGAWTCFGRGDWKLPAITPGGRTTVSSS